MRTGNSDFMHRSPGIVAHLIVGAKPEPYLAAALEAIADVCDHAMINDNSGSATSANAPVYSRSRLATTGRLTVIRTRFENFSAARNACIDATPKIYAGCWVLFVDADEVHGAELPAIAALLDRLPSEVDAVDGYSKHFWGSFRWWVAIERRLCFFRHAPLRRWHGAVHERLLHAENRAVVPAVWAHYGHVVTPRMEWEKSRLYASLGQGDWAPDDAALAAATAACVYGDRARRAMAHNGEHTGVAVATLAALSREWADNFREIDRLVALQTPIERLRNAGRALNYRRLLQWRAAEARLRWGWGAHGETHVQSPIAHPRAV
jgi:hypothetical protein